MSQTSQPEKDRPERRANITSDGLMQIRESLGGLRFGSVHITVQDGVIVQIDRTEKRRLRGFQASAK